MFIFFNKIKLYLYYFFEIKLRLMYLIISFLNTFLICYFFKDQLTFILTDFLLYNMSSHRFIFTKLTQIFVTYIKISFILSILINIPFIILHFFYFFLSSFYIHELKKNLIIIIISLFLYFLSLILTYYIIFPNIIDFFLSFEKKNNYFPIHFEAKFDEFFSMLFLFFFNIIISFQIPIIIYILIYKEFIKNSFIIKNRKIFYLFFLFISALIAPPDFLNQLFILILFLFLYEIFILFFIFFKKI